MRIHAFFFTYLLRNFKIILRFTKLTFDFHPSPPSFTSSFLDTFSPKLTKDSHFLFLTPPSMSWWQGDETEKNNEASFFYLDAPLNSAGGHNKHVLFKSYFNTATSQFKEQRRKEGGRPKGCVSIVAWVCLFRVCAPTWTVGHGSRGCYAEETEAESRGLRKTKAGLSIRGVRQSDKWLRVHHAYSRGAERAIICPSTFPDCFCDSILSQALTGSWTALQKCLGLKVGTWWPFISIPFHLIYV